MALCILGQTDPRLARGGGTREARRAVEACLAERPEHEKTGREMLDFLRVHRGSLTRACASGHFTGSAFVLDRSREATALLLHRKIGRWLQPGGHADGEGNLACVALREAREETGLRDLAVAWPAIDLDVHVIRGDSNHLHLDVRFLVLNRGTDQLTGNGESSAIRWFREADIDALPIDPALGRLARAGFTASREWTADNEENLQ